MDLTNESSSDLLQEVLCLFVEADLYIYIQYIYIYSMYIYIYLFIVYIYICTWCWVKSCQVSLKISLGAMCDAMGTPVSSMDFHGHCLTQVIQQCINRPVGDGITHFPRWFWGDSTHGETGVYTMELPAAQWVLLGTFTVTMEVATCNHHPVVSKTQTPMFHISILFAMLGYSI